jgi:hypothetical protein
MKIKIIFMVAIVSEMATAGIRIRKKKVFGLAEKSGQNLPEQSGQRFRSQLQPEMKAPQCELIRLNVSFLNHADSSGVVINTISWLIYLSKNYSLSMVLSVI